MDPKSGFATPKREHPDSKGPLKRPDPVSFDQCIPKLLKIANFRNFPQRPFHPPSQHASFPGTFQHSQSWKSDFKGHCWLHWVRKGPADLQFNSGTTHSQLWRPKQLPISSERKCEDQKNRSTVLEFWPSKREPKQSDSELFAWRTRIRLKHSQQQCSQVCPGNAQNRKNAF